MSDVSSVSGTSSSYTTNVSSTSSGISTGQTLRITGLNSGIDVDSTVTKLMAPYQLKIDRVQQDVQKVQWKQQMYDTIINDVKSFQSTYFNSADASNNITSASFFNTTSATSSSTAIAANASSSAATGSYTIAVNSLAAAPTIQGNALNTEIAVSDISKWNGTLSFTVGGATVPDISLSGLTKTGDDTKDISSLVSSINSAIASNSTLNGKLTVSSVSDSTGTYLKFNNVANSNIQMTACPAVSGSTSIVSPSSSTTMASLGFSGTSTLNLSYNSSSTPVSISVTGSETLAQLTADISAKTNGKVVGKFDDITGKFILTSSTTGSQSTLSVTNSTPGSDSLLNALGMSNLTSYTAQGQDANVTITPPGGTAQTISESSNTFSINGLSLTLNSLTASGSPATVNVTSDSSSVFTKFKGFMDKYNSLVTEINTKITEKTTSDYPPLTDAQKASMSDSAIQAWNAKAQQGLLRNDTNLSNLFSSLKDSMYSAVKGASMSFGSSSLGLDLTDDYTKDGTLVFTDTTGDTFKQALQNNSKDIINLFTQSSTDTSTPSTTYAGEGIAQRINDLFVSNVGLTGVKSTSSILGKMAYKQDSYSTYGTDGTNTFLDQLYQDNSKIKDLKSQFTTKQTAYYNQFSNLETMLTQLNAQSATVTSMLSNG